MKVQAITLLAAGAAAHQWNNSTVTATPTTTVVLPGKTDTPKTTTEVVSVLTTYCPAPTVITYGPGKEYTVTEAKTVTITDCPCTKTKTIGLPPPVYTYPAAPKAPEVAPKNETSKPVTSTKYTTEVVTAYTTYCPASTTLQYNNQTITVSKPTTITLQSCPCTLTKPVETVSVPAETHPVPPAETHPVPTVVETHPAPPAETHPAPPAETHPAPPAETHPAPPAQTYSAPPAQTYPAAPAQTQPASPAASQPVTVPAAPVAPSTTPATTVVPTTPVQVRPSTTTSPGAFFTGAAATNGPALIALAAGFFAFF